LWAGIPPAFPKGTTKPATSYASVEALRWVSANCVSRRIAVVNMSCEPGGAG
jgi:hypothetical protein